MSEIERVVKQQKFFWFVPSDRPESQRKKSGEDSSTPIAPSRWPLLGRQMPAGRRSTDTRCRDKTEFMSRTQVTSPAGASPTSGRAIWLCEPRRLRKSGRSPDNICINVSCNCARSLGCRNDSPLMASSVQRINSETVGIWADTRIWRRSNSTKVKQTVKMWMHYQPFNQSINQSISFDSINQSVELCKVHQSIDQSTEEVYYMDQTINKPINQTIEQSISQSKDHPTGQLLNDHSVKKSYRWK